MSSVFPASSDLRVDPGLPTVVSPRDGAGASIALDEAAHALRQIAGECIERTGGVLFSGFEVPSVDVFQRFAASFGAPLIEYARTA